MSRDEVASDASQYQHTV